MRCTYHGFIIPHQKFTDIIVVNEDKKTPNAMLITHLPDGPTVHFKLTSVKLNKEIQVYLSCAPGLWCRMLCVEGA